MGEAGAAIDLLTPVGRLEGVSAREAAGLAEMGLRGVGHLVAHVPSRYEWELPAGTISGLEAEATGTVTGEVTACRVAGVGRRQRFEAVLNDGTGRLSVVWFHAPYLIRKIGAGTRLRVQGKARAHQGGLQMANPTYAVLGVDEPEVGGETSGAARLRPVYPASERAKPSVIERAVRAALPHALPLIEEHLPAWVLERRGLPGLSEAYRMVHAPADEEEAARGRRRLAYDELVMLQLGVFLKRARVRRTMEAPALRHGARTREAILSRLPFTLTGAQSRVCAEIAEDLTRSVPANRLIQGDVGSGKTAVAAYAMLMAVASGHQAALMAPTEILAEQHDEGLRRLLHGSRVRTALLTGALPPGERALVLGRIERGEVDLVVGTHALLTERVRFSSLAVVVIDEQHRFGVHQRARLRTGETGEHDEASGGDGAGRVRTPHVLVMTATPIPRTLAMTLFGDLDVSTIDEMPPGRRPVETLVYHPDLIGTVDLMVRAAVDRGERVFVVVPTIEGGGDGAGELAGVEATRRRLEGGALSGARVGVVHGRMDRRTREHVMERFRRGLSDVLIATTVIEVGVDVPGATLMVVENAERFGLAQLHQLRGRVGRGSAASTCVLVGDPSTEQARQRLEAMAETTDGFRLAERDLMIRGPGDLLSAKQSGMPPFRVADLSRDLDLLAAAREDARAWVERSPNLDGDGEGVMRRRLGKRFGASMGLADVG